MYDIEMWSMDFHLCPCPELFLPGIAGEHSWMLVVSDCVLRDLIEKQGEICCWDPKFA